jgi:formamidopyrimidine-DNA glycosylase
MPELPEVETVRKTLLELLPGRTIQAVDVRLSRIIKFPAVAEFQQRLVGQRFLDIRRRGKYLIFVLTADQALVIHLRMTGQLRVSADDEPEPKHTHVVFQLDCGRQLRFTDLRTFGAMYLAPLAEIAQVAGMDKLGWEPLADFPLEDFATLLQRRTARIKSLLLDQRVIAGVGNIYADESLFQARIHPATPANQLDFQQIARLHRALVQVLQAGVDLRGTTFSDYVDGLGRSGDFQHQLCVYGREGQPCPSCGADIVRIKLGGRSAHLCPNCQRPH